MLKASVIAAFYNRTDYLKLVLSGFERQTQKAFELIIADDGSDVDTVRETEKILNEFSFPIIHIWQEDKGFRKNRILNRAITTARSDYLIFIDADCVPHSGFVEEHLLSSERGTCLTGRRVNLSNKFTHLLTPDNVKDGFLESHIGKMILDGLFGESFYVEKGFYFKNKWLRSVFNRKFRGLLGCNFSLYKKDILAINGFDERYIAPSIGEDSDVQFRLELKGTKIKFVNHIAVQYHLFHKLQARPKENLVLFDKIKAEKLAFTPYGIERI